MNKTFVFLTGWAMDEKIWDPLLSLLPQDLTVKHVSWFELHSSQAIDERVNELVNGLDHSQSITLVGWSLGSIAALKASSVHHEKIDRLILFDPTPRFLKDSASDFRFGWTEKSLNKMKDSLALNLETTLASFYQKMFTKKERDEQSFESFTKTHIPASPIQKDLQLGLDYLASSDVRDSLPNIKAPVQIFHGKQDKIISLDAGKWLSEELPHSSFHQIDSGHVPFFTNPHQCAQLMYRGFTEVLI